MPKGAIHHIHSTAAIPIDAYLKLTYDERTYFSATEQLFKVYPLYEQKPELIEKGYIPCVLMRKKFVSPQAFDKYLQDQILLNSDQTDNLSSHEIWKHFEKKFMKVGELGKYIPFFKLLL